MKKTRLESKKNGEGLLIFLAWLVYSTSYLGKVNYSANITQVMDFYHITKPEAGMVPTFLFFAYGIGQVVNGIMCKRYNIRWMIFISLFLSATINLIIAVSANFTYVKWLWMLNGFAMSVLWPTLIRMLSESLPQKSLARATVIMGTPVATGTLIIYALSSLFAYFDNFKFAFYTAAICGILVSIVWLFSSKKALSMAKLQREKEDFPNQTKKFEDEKIQQTKNEKKLFYVTVSILCFCAIGINLTKDGLTTWAPSILKEEYSMTDSLSILLTLFLPIVAIFANVHTLYMNKKYPDYITHCFVMFTQIAIFIGIIIGSLAIKQVVIMLISLVVVSFLASSLNSLFTSVFPMFMRGKVNSGLFAGVLNGFCYLGSTISSYGLGVIAEHFGWIAVFGVLIAFCVVVGLIWCFYSLYKSILTRQISPRC